MSKKKKSYRFFFTFLILFGEIQGFPLITVEFKASAHSLAKAIQFAL